MFHYFKGVIEKIGGSLFLRNESRGIQILYAGQQREGAFFLYPYLDENKKTIVYFAFDSGGQKQLFEDLLKIRGIGSKTAFTLAQYVHAELNTAVQAMDVKFFQAIPGIGPKSAKKIILELKGNIDLHDVAHIELDQKLFKDIVKSLKGFGYDAERIKAVLNSYEGTLSKEHMSEIIKRVISQL